VEKHGGRHHWGKGGLAWSQPSLIKSEFSESTREKFIATVNKYDPEGIFRNEFAYNLFGMDYTMEKLSATEYCTTDICIKKSEYLRNETNTPETYYTNTKELTDETTRLDTMKTFTTISTFTYGSSHCLV